MCGQSKITVQEVLDPQFALSAKSVCACQDFDQLTIRPDPRRRANDLTIVFRMIDNSPNTETCYSQRRNTGGCRRVVIANRIEILRI